MMAKGRYWLEKQSVDYECGWQLAEVFSPEDFEMHLSVLREEISNNEKLHRDHLRNREWGQAGNAGLALKELWDQLAGFCDGRQYRIALAERADGHDDWG